MNRRTFLKITAAAALAAEWMPSAGRSKEDMSAVAWITDAVYKKSGEADVGRLQAMLDRALSRIVDGETPEDAWRILFKPSDVIGIKINCLAGRGISTHPAVVEAIVRCLHRAGIPGKHIIVWDRSNRDLKSAGYKIQLEDGAYRCFGTNEVGYGEHLYENGSVGSLVSRIQTRMCSAIINVPVLKDHGITGVSLGMKNYYGIIHNPNKYHPGGGNPYIADLNALDIIRNKERLIICDGLQAQYHGGPAFVPAWNQQEGSLLLAFDPVALDATGRRIIGRIRKQHGMPTLREENREPTYILTAAEERALGNAAQENIDILKDTL